MKRDYADLISGAGLALLGGAVALYAATHWDIGTPRRMGPGFFPAGLGILLAGLGVMIAWPAWSRAGDPRRLAWAELIAVTAAIALFAAGLSRGGLVVVTAAAVLLASSAAPRPGIIWRLVLALAVTALAVAIFHLGLKMTLPLWPVLP